MPLPFTEEGRARQALLSSQEYLETSPEGRKEMLGIFKSASPADRKRFIFGEGETPGLTPAPERAAKEGLSMLSGMVKKSLTSAPKEIGESTSSGMIDMGGAAVGAITGGYLGSRTGIPGAGKVGATVGEASGAYLANQGNKLLGMREGKAFGTPDTGDYLSAGIPLGARTLAGGFKSSTKPAREALQASDEVRATNQADRAMAQGQGNKALPRMLKETDEANASNAQAYAEAVRKEKEGFLHRIETVNKRTDISNERKAALRAEESKAHADSITAHQEAYKTLPKKGAEGLEIGDYRAAYAASSEAAARAGNADLTPLLQKAEELGVSLKQPLDPFQNRFRRVTDALQQIDDPNVSVERLIATHQKLGRVVGSTEGRGGEEWGAAKKLWAATYDVLEQTKGKNPQAAKAVEEHLAGQKAFRQTESLKDWDLLFEPGHYGNKLTKDGVELSQTGILTGFDKLVKEDKFFAGSFPDHLPKMREALKELPDAIPTRPREYLEAKADYRMVRPEKDIPQPTTVEPDYSKVQSPWKQPSNETPDPGRFPYGRVIMAKVFAGEAGSAVAGQQGSNMLTKWAGGLIAAAPHWVSQVLLASERGQAIARNITARKQTLTPERLQALTNAARSLGGKPEDDTQ